MGIVGNDQTKFTFLPAVGSRRVSVFVCLPVILGCAALGSVLGVTHPLPSIVSKRPAELSLASITPIESVPDAGQKLPSAEVPARPQQPEAVATEDVAPRAASPAASPAIPAAAIVSTGSVARPQSPGVSERAALTVAEDPPGAHSEAAPRLTGQNHRAARVKRLRRVVYRRARKPKTSELEQLFAPMFQKKQ